MSDEGGEQREVPARNRYADRTLTVYLHDGVVYEPRLGEEVRTFVAQARWRNADARRGGSGSESGWRVVEFVGDTPAEALRRLADHVDATWDEIVREVTLGKLADRTE